MGWSPLHTLHHCAGIDRGNAISLGGENGSQCFGFHCMKPEWVCVLQIGLNWGTAEQSSVWELPGEGAAETAGSLFALSKTPNFLAMLRAVVDELLTPQLSTVLNDRCVVVSQCQGAAGVGLLQEGHMPGETMHRHTLCLQQQGTDPSFRVTQSLTNSPRQGSGLAGSIRVQSGVAGCGAGDKRLCPLLIYSFKCHQSHLLTNPTLQRGQGPSSRFSPVPGQLFCSCLWSDCRRSVCVWTWWGCARLWIQPTEPRRCLLLVGLRRLSSHGLYWNGLSCLPKAGAEKNRACSCLAHWCLLIMPLQPSLCLNCLCASTGKHITFFSQSMVIN